VDPTTGAILPKWIIEEEKAVRATLSCLFPNSREQNRAKRRIRDEAESKTGKAWLRLCWLDLVANLPVQLSLSNDGFIVSDREIEKMFLAPTRLQVVREFDDEDDRDGRRIGILFKVRQHGYFVVLPSNVCSPNMPRVLEIRGLGLNVVSLAALCALATTLPQDD
jgi:hypothetical protein